MLSKIVESAGAFVTAEWVISDIYLNPNFFVNLVKLGLWALFPLNLLSHLLMLLNHRPCVQLPSINRSKRVVTHFSLTIILSCIPFRAYFFNLFINLVQLGKSSNQFTCIYWSRSCLIFALILLTTIVTLSILNVIFFWFQVQSHDLWFLYFSLDFCMVFTVSELQRWLSRSVPVPFFLGHVDLIKLKFLRILNNISLLLGRI